MNEMLTYDSFQTGQNIIKSYSQWNDKICIDIDYYSKTITNFLAHKKITIFFSYKVINKIFSIQFFITIIFFFLYFEFTLRILRMSTNNSTLLTRFFLSWFTLLFKFLFRLLLLVLELFIIEIFFLWAHICIMSSLSTFKTSMFLSIILLQIIIFESCLFLFKLNIISLRVQIYCMIFILIPILLGC